MSLITSPKVSIITPNFNQERFLEKTILSVLGQNYPNIEYIIIDGGSTDRSIDIIKKYSSKLSYWLSEEDGGMYEAINKGFKKSTGDILCWINSDDIIHSNAISKVVKMFTDNISLQWLQGFPNVIDEEGKEFYKRNPMSNQLYFYSNFFKIEQLFIQQESTFFKRDLWEESGGKLNTNYDLAADFDLWLRFFNHADLYCTHHKLGAFRKREGQKSENIKEYLSQAEQSIKENYKRLPFISKLKIGFYNSFGDINYFKRNKWLD
ncbi:glycosyltransferase family 2 protein [Urechidicola sp. KH5]